MRTKRLTDEEILIELINVMFIIAGHNVTYNDIVGRKDQWYYEWTMTPEQEKRWMEYMVKFFRKHRSMTIRAAQQSASMFNLMWGLKVEQAKVPDIDNIN